MTHPIWRNLFIKKDTVSTADFLQTLPLFSSLSAQELAKLCASVHSRSFKANETIFKAQEEGESMYMIVAGTVCISAQHGTTPVTDHLKEGAFFGELSLIDPQKRDATAVATTPCELLVLFRTDLLTLTGSNPRIAASLFHELSRILTKRLRYACTANG